VRQRRRLSQLSLALGKPTRTRKPDPTDAEIAALIERELGSWPLDLHHLRGGQESQAFGFEQSGQCLVLRVRTAGEGFQKEAMLQQRLASPALPIPAVLAQGTAGPSPATSCLR